jgi:hypothetical protein
MVGIPLGQGISVSAVKKVATPSSADFIKTLLCGEGSFVVDLSSQNTYSHGTSAKGH